MSKVADNFLPIFYDGIGPVPFTSLSEDGNITRYSTYEYPHRPLQDAVSQEYDKLIVSGELAFINGLEGYLNLWPDLFVRFRKRLKQPELANFQHPLTGEIWGFFSQWKVNYNVRELNGCRVQFVFEEVAEDDRTRPDYVRDSIMRAAEEAQFADAAVQKLASPANYKTRADVTQPSKAILAFSTGPSFSTRFSSFASYIQGADLIATAIQQQADQILAYTQSVLRAPELILPSNYLVRNSMVAFASAVQESADAAKAAAGSIQILAPLPFPLSPIEVAQRIYADPSRASEIYQLNPISMFEYPTGYKLRVPSLDFFAPSSISKGQTSIGMGSSLQIPGSGLSVSLPLATR